jgi:hypothetical protein
MTRSFSARAYGAVEYGSTTRTFGFCIGVLDAKEGAQVAAQPGAQTEIGMILGRQLSGFVQPNLVEHPRK